MSSVANNEIARNIVFRTTDRKIEKLVQRFLPVPLSERQDAMGIDIWKKTNILKKNMLLPLLPHTFPQTNKKSRSEKIITYNEVLFP